MRIRKPISVRTKSFVFRPRGPINGKYSIGLALESSGKGAVALLNWCGSRRQIHLLGQLSSYMTNLSLPLNLSGDDVFVLTIDSPAPLIVSIDLWFEGKATDDIMMEQMDGETSIETLCSNPATDGDRKFEDSLVLGQAPVASRRWTPVGSIESLRAMPEGAMLYLSFHRPENAPERDLMVTAVVGPMRRLCIIAAGRKTNGLTFWLQPEAAAENWPLILYGDQPFAWSGAAQRGYDAVFLPAFSLVDAPPASGATQ